MGNVKKLKLEIEKRIMGLLIMIIPPTQVISRNYKTMQRDVMDLILSDVFLESCLNMTHVLKTAHERFEFGSRTQSIILNLSSFFELSLEAQ
jgi:hypothetical protein